jgi:hypothetical protein
LVTHGNMNISSQRMGRCAFGTNNPLLISPEAETRFELSPPRFFFIVESQHYTSCAKQRPTKSPSKHHIIQALHEGGTRMAFWIGK